MTSLSLGVGFLISQIPEQMVRVFTLRGKAGSTPGPKRRSQAESNRKALLSCPVGSGRAAQAWRELKRERDMKNGLRRSSSAMLCPVRKLPSNIRALRARDAGFCNHHDIHV